MQVSDLLLPHKNYCNHYYSEEDSKDKHIYISIINKYNFIHKNMTCVLFHLIIYYINFYLIFYNVTFLIKL
jgi:hypothetical protein